ncbi:MAG: GntR family transcriptional regulator [Holophagaceae bacterium]|nr:GntR family transcriptional regulator [Holophagaceae bacterium]
MAELGIWSDLTLIRMTPQGASLDGGELGEVFLPLDQAPAGCMAGQAIAAFLYLDNEGRLNATTRKPLAQRGEVANLKIATVNKLGAFLAWGLPQNLFLPWKEVKREQKHLIQEGQKIMVVLFTDEDGRMNASTRLEEFLGDEAEGFKEGDKVSLVICDPTDLGVRVVVNHRYWGMVHTSDIFCKLTRGEIRDGYIKALRADHKLNVSLSPPGYTKVGDIAQGVLDVLKRQGGFMSITDKSRPEEIYALFGISKKVFKQTLGALYKTRRIVIGNDGIRLVRDDPR